MNLGILWERFPNDDACLDELLKLRKIKCCQEEKLYKIKGRKAYACSCGKHFYPLKGTIFEKSTTPLRYWFYAMFLITSTRAGISAKQLERELGVTYKTAWRIFTQIRKLMEDNDPVQLSGVVEIDEAYIGGRRINHWGVGNNNKDKEILWGAVQRGGKVKIKHIPNTGHRTLYEQIQKTIATGSMINSDELPAYKNIFKFGYTHESVSHHKREYAREDVTTNRIENVWSHLKPGLTAVHRKVTPKYLQSYADEFAFRYNNRSNPEGMFDLLLARVPVVIDVKIATS